MRKECTVVQLEYDDKFFCGFEFGKEYDKISIKRYGRVNEEAINDKLKYVK